MIEAREREIRLGLRVVPSVSEKAKKRPISELMDEYMDWGNAQGGRGGRPWSPMNSRKRRYYLDWWTEALNLKKLSDLHDRQADAEKALRSLKNEKGRAGKTLESYKEGLLVFCSWCLERKYLTENPFGKMAKFDTRAVNPRRSMALEDIMTLLDNSNEDRRLLYETAFSSGFRANELRSLTPAHLEEVRCCLHLHADDDKGRKERYQPISRDLLTRLIEYGKTGRARELYRQNRTKAGEKPDEQVPDNPLLYVPSHPARVIQDDLKKLGIPVVTEKGKIDFHACRKAYINMVIAAGADVKTAQTLSRHSTAYLTMEVYAEAEDPRLTNVAELVGAMMEQNGKI